jgi:diphthine synthase
MLYLIGAGFKPTDISLEAVDVAKACDKLYAEDYTMKYDFEELGKIIGKRIEMLDRKDVEEELKFLDRAKDENVALFVPGDPLAATTHITILTAAREKGIHFFVLHSQSIRSAIAETGLHIYKFGKTVSIPEYQKGFEPTSFYDIIEQNNSIGAHSLILIDPGMKIKRAIEILLDAEKKKAKGLISEDMLILAAHIGERTKIVYDKVSNLKNVEMHEPFCLVIPAKLHFSEQEVLEKLYKEPDS